jgi:DNA-binding NtrC family response regulator
MGSQDLRTGSGAGQDGVVGVLVSSNNHCRRELGTLFEAHGWRLHYAGDWRKARRLLEKMDIPIVIVDGDAGNPSWREVVSDLSRFSLRVSPRLIVTSRHLDDALWAEVLNLGAYDLLAEPLQEDEADWVIGQALCDWRREAQ